MSYEPSFTTTTHDQTIRDEDKLAGLFKALGHPARLKILQHLLEEDRCICGRIVEILPLAQSTVSQHLKILKESGLVRGEVEGPKTCYCVDRKKLAIAREALEVFCNWKEEQ